MAKDMAEKYAALFQSQCFWQNAGAQVVMYLKGSCIVKECIAEIGEHY